jgi:hypothetical protein
LALIVASSPVRLTSDLPSLRRFSLLKATLRLRQCASLCCGLGRVLRGLPVMSNGALLVPLGLAQLGLRGRNAGRSCD